MTSTAASVSRGHQFHLVRHGEVDNPDHVVYADLPGFGLSARGVSQAVAGAAHLATFPVARVVTSPLQRAIETAGFIAARHGIGVTVDERLTEWRLSTLWAGIVWEDLPKARPGELEAYLEDPADLSFAPESLSDLAQRMISAIHDHAAHGGDVVVVSHQDPIQAAIRRLTGRGFDDFGADKPAHVTVLSLSADGSGWRLSSRFQPEQGPLFPPPAAR